MSEIKVNKISPRTACGTTTLGDSGDTFTIPAGVTITNSGTAAGFGATGAASWDTTVKTSGFTAVSGVGYFVNTTAGAITVILPASPSAGDVVAVSDYAGTADTNNITIGRNSSNINGAAADLNIQNENSAVTLVYVDGTQGWKATDTSNLSDIELQPTYVTATGGTITTSGDYKIHTFTGPGTFCVSAVGNPLGSDSVDYMVVAGGGSGGGSDNRAKGGGGGAGGYRESSGAASGCYSVSPLGACVSALPVSVTTYPVTVGGGGTKASGAPINAQPGNPGSNSVFSTIISTGGGAGATYCQVGFAGGSGGGGSVGSGPTFIAGQAGNTPPVSPPQGFSGGNGVPYCGSGDLAGSGGGGGATAVGQNGNTSNPTGVNGGAGATTSISSSPTAYAGGGGAAGGPGGGGSGGTGGGGPGHTTYPGPGIDATANTGGGGGAAGAGIPSGLNLQGGSGGSGIVIIRYKFQN